MEKIVEMLNTQSHQNLLVWCFSEAIRTRDKDALALWFAEAERRREKKG